MVSEVRNSDVDWDRFDAKSYLHHNYRTLRGDDRRFIAAIRDFFDKSALPPRAAGIDVGSGANLYPALAMLPFVERLTLLDYSASNVQWLQRQLTGFDSSWDPFWATYCSRPAYAEIADPRAVLRRVASVVRRDLFRFVADVPYDVGTMFFVAESLSSSRAEFDAAVRRFLDLLKPGAPFAAAFMENSVGYRVGDVEFPAVQVTTGDVARSLSAAAEGLSVHYEPAGVVGALRPGYDGMILAVGRRKT